VLLLKKHGGKKLKIGYFNGDRQDGLSIYSYINYEAFDANDQFDMFCSKECKEEALADLDKDSDECLSCQ
jgi:hypothetical protein